MNLLPIEKQNLVARWLSRGMSLRSAANLAGVNRNTVLKYKKLIAAGIFKLNYAPVALDRRNPFATMPIKLSRSALDRLEDVADQLGTDRRAIAIRIIETVVADDLFVAVLSATSWTQPSNAQSNVTEKT